MEVTIVQRLKPHPYVDVALSPEKSHENNLEDNMSYNEKGGQLIWLPSFDISGLRLLSWERCDLDHVVL